MHDIAFACPLGKQHLEAPSDMIGQKIDCPSCGKEIIILASNVKSDAFIRRSENTSYARSTYYKVIAVVVMVILLITTTFVLLRMHGTFGRARDDDSKRAQSQRDAAGHASRENLHTGKQNSSGLASWAISYADVVLEPERYRNQKVLFEGTFVSKSFDRGCFRIESSDHNVEVYFEDLDKQDKAKIFKTPDFSQDPVYVIGKLKEYSDHPKAYYIWAYECVVGGDWSGSGVESGAANHGPYKGIIGSPVFPLSLEDAEDILGKPDAKWSNHVEWGEGYAKLGIYRVTEPQSGLAFHVGPDEGAYALFKKLMTSGIFTQEEARGILGITEVAAQKKQVAIGRFWVSWNYYSFAKGPLRSDGFEFTVIMNSP